MTIQKSLILTIKILEKNKIPFPALDAEILLSFVIKKPKEFLYAHSERKLTVAQILKFKKLITRRAQHEPVAYITGHKYFYGLDFFVDKNVLIPRPETEILVEEAIKKIQNPKSKIQNPIIVDVGTGSGCIAITLAKNLPTAKIFVTEISPGAAEIARKNIHHHKVAVTLFLGNLLEPIIKNLKSETLKFKSLIIAANLPYLTTRQWQKTQPEIKKYEPRQALDGGKDGLKYYRELLEQLKKLKISNYKFHVSCFFEIDPLETKRITKIIKRDFPTAKIEIKKDLAGRDRIVIFSLSF